MKNHLSLGCVGVLIGAAALIGCDDADERSDATDRSYSSSYAAAATSGSAETVSDRDRAEAEPVNERNAREPMASAQPNKDPQRNRMQQTSSKDDGEREGSTKASKNAGEKPKASSKQRTQGSHAEGDMHELTLQDDAFIDVRKSGPNSIRVGESYRYEIEVTNTSEHPLMDVTATEAYPGSFKLSTTGNRDGQKIQGVEGDARQFPMHEKVHSFNVGMLEAGESTTLTLRGSAQNQRSLEMCTIVDYKPMVCMPPVTVTKPQMELDLELFTDMEGEQELDVGTPRLICDPVMAQAVVRNSGSGTLKDVSVTIQMPEGLMVDGKDKIERNVGNIDAGQSKTLNMMRISSQNTGSFSLDAFARSSRGLTAQDTTETFTLNRAKLDFELAGPGESYINKSMTFTATVSNVGSIAAPETIAMIDLPDGVEYLSTSAERTQDKEMGREMFLGTLEPGESREIEIVTRGVSKGQFRVSGQASAYCANKPSDRLSLDLMGIPALLLEVVDTDHDPIQVGNEGEYTIRVRNQGSAKDTGVQIIAQLPSHVRFVEASGPTDIQRRDGNTIVFKKIKDMNPDATAEWTIKTKALESGRAYIRVNMKSDELRKTVIENEQTTLY